MRRRSPALVAPLALLLLAPLLGGAGCSLLRARGPDRTDLPGAGAAVPEVGAPSEEAEGPAATTLGVNDVFEVRVFEEQELTGVYRVGADGAVSYPLCGRVEVGGLDASAVAGRITTCLKQGYLRNPQVSVFIKEYNSKKIFVLGQVQKPGTFTFEDRMSVVEAVTRAGGFTRLAAKNQVVINRIVDGKEQRLRIPVEDISLGLAPNFVLQPGDIVFIPESFF
ncbi:MAG: polysaccharide export protein [Deltaproteobacteria bacterium]|nr:polysaccharide export protein [Deltaproteobacteria bacterium]